MVGLHPDLATDHIVEIGLDLGIPWAIVPCCVFPNFCHYRTLAAGKPVRSYEDLCQWLRERDPLIRETILPFRGRNRVFYWHPPTTPQQSSWLLYSTSMRTSKPFLRHNYTFPENHPNKTIMYATDLILSLIPYTKYIHVTIFIVFYPATCGGPQKRNRRSNQGVGPNIPFL